MKELLTKYFGRILAIFGCTTLVTACYGVPYSAFSVTGRVVDSETDQPIKDIEVRAVPSNEDLESYPYDCTSSTDSGGTFEIIDFLDNASHGYTIKCTDVDGDLNGSYESVIQEVSSNEANGIVIRMTPKHQ